MIEAKNLPLLSRIHEIYRSGLEDFPEGRDFLISQGIQGAALWDRFELGYAPGRLMDILPAGDEEILAGLRALGVLTGKKDEETLSGCVVIPIYSARGQIIQLVGYPVDGPTPKTAGVLGGVFNWQAMKTHPEVAVLADPLEAIRKIAGGQEAVVALVGDQWTDLTSETFKEIAPHAVTVEGDGRGKIVQHLKKLGLLSGEESGEPESEKIRDGIAATFGKRRYLVQAITRKGAQQLRAVVRALGRTSNHTLPDTRYGQRLLPHTKYLYEARNSNLHPSFLCFLLSESLPLTALLNFDFFLPRTTKQEKQASLRRQ